MEAPAMAALAVCQNMFTFRFTKGCEFAKRKNEEKLSWEEICFLCHE